MRDRITAVLALALMTGVFRLAAPRCVPHCPQDFRDAPRSAGAAEGLPAGLAAVDVPAPPAPQNAAAGACGFDVSAPLGDVVRKIEAAYNSWTPQQREDRCLAMDLNTKHPAIDAWDIEDLRSDLGYPSSISRDIKRDGPCARTLAVDGKCFRAEEINYVMWGEMTRLCGKSLRWSSAKVRAYLLYYYSPLSKDHRGKKDSAYEAEAYNKVAWTRAGYSGWPSGWSPYATRPECTVSGRSAGPVSCGAHWADVDIR